MRGAVRAGPPREIPLGGPAVRRDRAVRGPDRPDPSERVELDVARGRGRGPARRDRAGRTVRERERARVVVEPGDATELVGARQQPVRRVPLLPDRRAQRVDDRGDPVLLVELVPGHLAQRVRHVRDAVVVPQGVAQPVTAAAGPDAAARLVVVVSEPLAVAVLPAHEPARVVVAQPRLLTGGVADLDQAPPLVVAEGGKVDRVVLGADVRADDQAAGQVRHHDQAGRGEQDFGCAVAGAFDPPSGAVGDHVGEPGVAVRAGGREQQRPARLGEQPAAAGQPAQRPAGADDRQRLVALGRHRVRADGAVGGQEPRVRAVGDDALVQRGGPGRAEAAAPPVVGAVGPFQGEPGEPGVDLGVEDPAGGDVDRVADDRRLRGGRGHLGGGHVHRRCRGRWRGDLGLVRAVGVPPGVLGLRQGSFGLGDGLRVRVRPGGQPVQAGRRGRQRLRRVGDGER